MIAGVIPAAGKGERLGAEVPKALVSLNGRPLISYVIAALCESVDTLVIVVAPDAREQFVRVLDGLEISLPTSLVIQNTPAGSADAVKVGLDRLDDDDRAIVAWGDQVGLSARTVAAVAAELQGRDVGLVLPLVEVTRPYVWFHASGASIHVSRQRDGDPSPPRGLSDVGCFGLAVGVTKLALDSLRRAASATREPDFVYALSELASMSAWSTLDVDDPFESLGVNTPHDLDRASGLLVERLR